MATAETRIQNLASQIQVRLRYTRPISFSNPLHPSPLPNIQHLSISLLEMATSSDLPRNDFYQSEDKFTVSFYVKGLKAEDVSVSFRETSVRPSSSCRRVVDDQNM